VRVKSPAGMTTPVRHCPAAVNGRSKASALNPVLSQNARPVRPFSHPNRRRGDRSYPPCNTSFLSSLWPANSGLAALRRPGAESGIGARYFASAHSIRCVRLATGFKPFPLLGADHLLLLVGVGAFGLLHQLNAVALMPCRRCVGLPVGLSGGQLPLANLVAALASSLLGLLILRSRAGPAPRPHLLRGLVGDGFQSPFHAMLHAI